MKTEWEQMIKNKVYGKLVFTSSPDRGLANVIYLLPFIKDQIPEIHLDVAYGFGNWEAAAKSRNDVESLKQIDNLKKTLESMPYVKFFGRLSQPDLVKEFWLKAYCWLYIDTFQETFCCTAKEAQCSATPSITSNVAALETTVGNFGTRILHDPYSREGRQQAVDEIVRLHKDKKYWEECSKKAFNGRSIIDWNYTVKSFWNTYV